MADKYANLTVPERIEKALELLREHPSMSLRKASTIFNVHASSLSRRHRGVTNSRKKVSQERQLLTPAEEETLIKYALLYSRRGLPLHIKQLRQLASEMLHRKSCQLELGLHWHLALLRRNPQIKETLAQPVQRSRSAATKEPAVKQWFTLFHDLRTEHAIRDEHVYNMDEKGLMLGPVQRSTVLVTMEQKQAYIRDGGKQEWVSIIECVQGGSNSKAISPFIISRSKRHQSAWFDGSDSNARVDQRDKVWTDKEISLNWLTNHFQPLTLPSDPNTKRLLIVNNHESHCTIDFIEFCDTHNIILLILPPHSAQFLQPLDVSCFGPLEQAYSTEVEAHGQYNGTFVEESEFIIFYQHARYFGLSPANISAGFQATGLIPYNPQLIYNKIANNGPDAPREKLVVPEADRQDLETMRKIRALVETIHDESVRQALLDKL